MVLSGWLPFVHGIVVSQFVSSTVFAVNQWPQHERVGRWKEHLCGEQHLEARRSGRGTLRRWFQQPLDHRWCARGGRRRWWDGVVVVRVRSGTRVDPELLAAALAVRPGAGNARVVDEALAERHRPTQVNRGAAYDEHPLAEPDRWSGLASWRRAAGQGSEGADGTSTATGDV